MLASLMSQAGLQVVGTSIQLLQDTTAVAEPNLESIVYSLDIDLPEWMRGEEDQNNKLAMWGQILTGFGISVQVAAFLFSTVTESGAFYHIIGLFLSLSMALVYLWALFNWIYAL
jgi:hypothetical protein